MGKINEESGNKMTPSDVAAFNKLHFMSDMHHTHKYKVGRKSKRMDTLNYTTSKKFLNVVSKIPGGKLAQLVITATAAVVGAPLYGLYRVLPKTPGRVRGYARANR